MAIFDIWSRYATADTHHPVVEVTGHAAPPDRLQEVVSEFTEWAQRCGGPLQEQQLEMLRLLEESGFRIVIVSGANLKPNRSDFVAAWAVKIMG